MAIDLVQLRPADAFVAVAQHLLWLLSWLLQHHPPHCQAFAALLVTSSLKQCVSWRGNISFNCVDTIKPSVT